MELGGGFIIMLALLYYLLGVETLAALILAALVHELGHLAALYFMGMRLKKLRLGALGACMEADDLGKPYLKTAAAALAGPRAGLVFYFMLLSVDGTFALASLALSLLNLLPVSGLDGGCALLNLLSHAFGPAAAERIVCLTSCAAILALFAAGFFAFNFTLALAAGWLLIDLARNML